MGSGKSYAVIDLETTGLDCWTDLITEIGVMVVTPGVRPQAESVLVKIDRPLPEKIVRLTGITDQLLAREGVSIDNALLWFKERVGDLPLVGHNVIRFDRAFLLEAARQHRRTVTPELRALDEVDDLPAYRFIDTMALFKGYKLCLEPEPGESHYQYSRRVWQSPGRGIRSGLSSACNDVGVDTSTRAAHRAANDVIVTQQLFEKMLQVHSPASIMLGGKYGI
ncbi:MAG: 3'-5' exonuclease [Chloroflexi bacterium]|nr:3'-5' exonuclease [Chloroflexota bacterium]MDA1219715.1 3'-5' exonuclease [Chloroflexota bacterium]